jgi:type I restriction enzyme S subunit
MSGTIGTSIPYIKKENLTDFSILLQKSSEEQLAIARVLSDMDSEIEDLETKVDKYKQIKQGMMQNLLTGRIRLV